MHAAIEKGDKETYALLLDKGADCNLCDRVGTSAVHLAAEQEDVFWLRAALKYRGNPNQPNTGNTAYPNETPIYYAISKGRAGNVLELVKAGADVNHVDGDDITHFYKCVEKRMYATALQLIEAGANPTPKPPASSILGSSYFGKNYEKGVMASRVKGELEQYRLLKAKLKEMGCLKEEVE